MAGQSDPHLSIFSAAEVEFLAEDELVEIIPNMSMDSLNFICGDFGPFYPHIPTEVPIWLAMALKKRGKCAIRPPSWMSLENLTQVLELERDSPREFQPLPFHYVEISRLLFDHAREDIPDVHMVIVAIVCPDFPPRLAFQKLVLDIEHFNRDVRFHKVESGFETIGSRTHAVKLKNLSAMEVNIVRPFFVRALQAFYKHDSPQMIPQPDTASRRTDTGDRGPRRDLRPR
ncbi:hypothetical protein C5167_001194 [Papaver somniferum]|uniref:DNA replication complex GINS protein PSF2 n=1 Tax=Papaver somniferum TaxID=3469 RepID=A0A4Y7KUM0_PAPSO|nr:hypothetical protein C5167_001194 [Papaver somniferum]